MAETRRVALFLTREDEAQQMWAKTVREESQRRGFALIDASYRPELVASQSEVMVEGIRRALARLAREFSRPELERLPITACDGMPAFKRAVDERRLAATIEIPSRATAAMQVLVDFWTRGQTPAGLELLLPPSSYPSLEDLAHRAL